MKRRVGYYLVKLNRISGWLLFVVMPILFITGYGITGRYGWASALASAELHSRIHSFFIPWALWLYVLHAGLNVYFFAKRHWKKAGGGARHDQT